MRSGSRCTSSVALRASSILTRSNPRAGSFAGQQVHRLHGRSQPASRGTGFEHASSAATLEAEQVRPRCSSSGRHTGVQIASMFHAFGTRVELFERGPRVLPSEDESVAAAVEQALRESGYRYTSGSAISGPSRRPRRACESVHRRGRNASAEAALAVVAAGWVADTTDLNCRQPASASTSAATSGRSVSEDLGAPHLRRR